MLEKMLLLGEAFVTFVATVGPLSGVDALMPDQVRGVAEVLAAVEAGQGAGAAPGMQPLMRDEALLLGEALRAPATAIRPLAPMTLGVLPIGGLDVEGLHTLGAAVRLVHARPPREGLQIMALLEGLRAGDGGVPAAPGVDMLVQGELLLVGEALFAGRRRGAVAFLVRRQALVKAEAFPAIRTSKHFVLRAVARLRRDGRTATRAETTFARQGFVFFFWSGILGVPSLLHKRGVAAADGGGLRVSVEERLVRAFEPQAFAQRSLSLENLGFEGQPVIWGD